MGSTKKKVPSNKGNKSIFITVGVLLAVIFAVVFIIKSNSGGKETSANGDNLVIPKSEITGIAKFYPYKVGGTNMEVLALKASDGTIRTAFNTCQVCYSSGRGYYKLDGNVLVCQNCGNRFKPDQVEKEIGGCNPVPIFSESKNDDGQNIIISKEFLQKARVIFVSWKKQ